MEKISNIVKKLNKSNKTLSNSIIRISKNRTLPMVKIEMKKVLHRYEEHQKCALYDLFCAIETYDLDKILSEKEKKEIISIIKPENTYMEYYIYNKLLKEK